MVDFARTDFGRTLDEKTVAPKDLKALQLPASQGATAQMQNPGTTTQDAEPQQ